MPLLNEWTDGGRRFGGLLRFAERATSLGIGFVFLIAGSAHLANPYYLLTRAIDYPFIGPNLATAISVILPTLEIVLGICLVSRIMPLSAHLMAASILAAFAVAQATALAYGLEIDCGCFGPASAEPVSMRTIGRTAGLDAAIIVGCLCEFRLTRRPYGIQTVEKRSGEAALRHTGSG